MMGGHLADFLRAAISSIAVVLFMLTLLRPRYSPRVTWTVMMVIVAVDLLTAGYCYTHAGLTQLAKLDILLFFALCLAARPLFKGSFMQWLFSILTIQNIFGTVVVLSFLGSRWLPAPAYANAALRVLLFGLILWLLIRYGRPLQRQVIDQWSAYFAVALAISLGFAYYILLSDDIVATMGEQAVPLLLLIGTGAAAYGSIYFSMKSLQKKFDIQAENQAIRADNEFLQISAKAMAERLRAAGETDRLNRQAAHDRRHFDNTLLELLDRGQAAEAAALLRSRVPASETEGSGGRIYCENTVVNAAAAHYARLAESAGITPRFRLDIPEELAVDSLELAMVAANLLENAIRGGQEARAGGREGVLTFTCCQAGRLMLEMTNPCADGVDLDEQGFPSTNREGHGLGTKGVIAFVRKYDGELLYQIQDGLFRVRLLV